MHRKIGRWILGIALAVNLQAVADVGEEKSLEKGNKTVSDEIELFLNDLEPEEEWNAWVAQIAPAYGNYCGPGHGDETYEAQCVSRLDCICKEHDFGYSLRRYLEADAKMVSQILDLPLAPIARRGPDYETLLHVAALTSFAGKIASAQVSNRVRAAFSTYEEDPEEAKKTLDAIIDEDEIFRKKIEDIRRERAKYEIGPGVEPTFRLRTMSVSLKPLGLFVGIIGFSYEVKAAEILSFRFSGSVLGGGLVTDTFLDYLNTKNFSVGLDVGSKIFVDGRAMSSGFYLEPRCGVSYENVVQRDGSRARAVGVTPALLFGFDKVFALGLHVDVGLGVGYHKSFLVGDVPPIAISTQNVIPQVQGSIGWAW